MKEVYFKQIMIADLQNKTARVQSFEKRAECCNKHGQSCGKILIT